MPILYFFTTVVPDGSLGYLISNLEDAEGFPTIALSIIDSSFVSLPFLLYTFDNPPALLGARQNRFINSPRCVPKCLQIHMNIILSR